MGALPVPANTDITTCVVCGCALSRNKVATVSSRN
jgi:hypothetical protein